MPRPVISFCLEPQAEPRPHSQQITPVHYLLSHASYWKIFSMVMQKENKTQTDLDSKPNLKIKCTHLNRQRKRCTGVWRLWTGSDGCRLGFVTKVFTLAALGMLSYLKLQVCFLTNIIAFLLEGKATLEYTSPHWIRGICKEILKMQGTILSVLLFSALVHCKHLCFTRTGTESSQALTTRSSPTLFVLNNLDIAVTCESCFLHSVMGTSFRCSAVLQGHTLCKDPSQCRCVATYTRTINCFVPYQSKAPLLPFVYMQNGPWDHQKMCPGSAVLYYQ